jgi:hypothetical protein
MLKERGGLLLPHAEFKLFGRTVASPLWFTWPFATLECHPDRLLIRAPFVEISIRLDEIDEVEAKAGAVRQLTLRQQVVIQHHGVGSSPIVFLPFSAGRIMAMLRESGVRV